MNTASFETFVYHWSTNNYDSEIKFFAAFPMSENYLSETFTETICVRILNFYRHCYVLSDKPYSVVNFIERTFNRQERCDYAVSCSVVERKSYYEYESGKRLYVLCKCKKRSAIYKLVERLTMEENSLAIRGIYEHNASDVCQFTSSYNLPTAGWISICDAVEIVDPDKRVSVCDREYIVNRASQLKVCERYDKCNLKILSFDIEVNSQIANTFPSDRPDDAIFQISGVVSGMSDGKIEERYLLTLRGVDDDELKKLSRENEITISEFDDEISLIRGFFNLVETIRPNIVTGYNLFGFDIGYLMKRCERFLIVQDMYDIGYLKEKSRKPVKEISWSSSAFSNQQFVYVDWQGILIVDLLPIVRNILQMKLSNYKLDTVAAHVLEEGKDPVTYKEIFEAYASKRFARVGKYCVRDSELCARIVDKCFVVATLCELARASNVPIITLYTQGQQIRVYSNVYKYCVEQEIVVNQSKKSKRTDARDAEQNDLDDDSDDQDKFVGATVFEPIPGMYRNVVPFDFSSLYPSIIISNNICPTTLKPESVPFDETIHERYAWSDHINCEHDENVIRRDDISKQIDSINDDISKLMTRRDAIDSCYAKLVGSTVSKCRFEIQKDINALRQVQSKLRNDRKEYVKRIGSKNRICGDREYYFLKPHVRTGVLPKISRDLIDSRKQVRKMYESETDESKRAILNARQLALKIIANSVYGSTGVKNGYLPCMPCAMTVTYIGRKSTRESSTYILEKFGGNLIYGDTDSNYITFPNYSVEKDGELWSFVKMVADKTSELFPKPMKLEFEGKLYEKFIIFAKKRYITKEIYASGKVGVGYRGVVLARRDNCEYLREMYYAIVNEIFRNETNVDAVYQTIETCVDKMFRRGAVSDEKFIITKSVKNIGEDDDADFGNYKIRKRQLPSEGLREGMSERQYHLENSGCPGQLVLADRMRKRGTPVDAGSRIEYVVLDDGSCNDSKLNARMEDYDYYKTRRRYLKLDNLYYLKTFVQSIDQLLLVAMGIGDFTKCLYEIRKRYAECCRKICRKNIIFAPS